MKFLLAGALVGANLSNPSEARELLLRQRRASSSLTATESFVDMNQDESMSMDSVLADVAAAALTKSSKSGKSGKSEATVAPTGSPTEVSTYCDISALRYLFQLLIRHSFVSFCSSIGVRILHFNNSLQ